MVFCAGIRLRLMPPSVCRRSIDLSGVRGWMGVYDRVPPGDVALFSGDCSAAHGVLLGGEDQQTNLYMYPCVVGEAHAVRRRSDQRQKKTQCTINPSPRNKQSDQATIRRDETFLESRKSSLRSPREYLRNMCYTHKSSQGEHQNSMVEKKTRKKKNYDILIGGAYRTTQQREAELTVGRKQFILDRNDYGRIMGVL